MNFKLSTTLILSAFLCNVCFFKQVKSDLNNTNNFYNNDKELNINYLKTKPQSEYILDSGDFLKISVSRDYPELETAAVIDGEGRINLPLLDSIYVRKLTLNELKKLLNEAFLSYVNFPNIEIAIIAYRKINVMVEGEVNNPGLYSLMGSIGLKIPNLQDSGQFENDTVSKLTGSESALDYSFQTSLMLSNENPSIYFPTVFDAIRTSGGITRYSDLSHVEIVRNNSISNGSGKIKTVLNFETLPDQIDNSKNIRIYDGDKIFVKKRDSFQVNKFNKAVSLNLNPRYIDVFVTGRVNNPGLKKIVNRTTLNDAIDIAGGTRVLRGPVNYVTYDNNDYKKTVLRYRRNAKRGSKNNPYLKQGDLISVSSSIFSVSSEVLSELTRPFQGLYSTYRLIQLIQE